MRPADWPADSVVKHRVRGARWQFTFVKHDISVTSAVSATKREEPASGTQADRQDARKKGQQTPWDALFRPPESVVNNRVEGASGPFTIVKHSINATLQVLRTFVDQGD